MEDWKAASAEGDRYLSAQTLHSVVVGTASAAGSQFFRSLVEHVASALGARYAFVTRCDGSGNARSLAFWSGDGLAEDFEYNIVGHPCYQVMQGETLHVEKDIQLQFPSDTGLVDWGAESYLGVPMLDEDRGVVGHIAVLDTRPMTYSPHAVELLTIFAARATAELKNLQARSELQASLDRVQALEARHRTLLEINNMLISNLTQEELFQAISEALRQVVAFDRSAIFLHDPESDRLRLLVAETKAVPFPHFVPGWEVPVEGSLGGWVFRNCRALRRNNLAREHEYEIEKMLLDQGFRSLVLVPLIVRGKPIGTLNLASLKGDQYPDDKVEYLQEVANQVALAIENMRSYEEIAALQAKLQAENVYLQEEIQTEHNFEEIVGNHPSMLVLLRNVETVAPTDSTVLILGETGTGKELIARAIHSRSKRKNRPLVKVNCGAIPTGLVESELFGHMKGAFTGALERRVGRFELADGGTLFLDEVSELPLETQVKLLRVLQEHEFEPLGSSRTIRVDVRLIAASNRNMEKFVEEGRFRPDLYYRLNVLPIVLPSLRERRSDIRLLTAFFVERFSRQLGKVVSAVSTETMELLTRYDWPGNIRELQNVIERAVVLSSGPVLKLGRNLLPATSSERSSRAPESVATVESGGTPSGESEAPSLAQMEKRHILAVLARTDWQIEGPRGAALILDIHPNTLRSRMKKLGIKRPAMS